MPIIDINVIEKREKETATPSVKVDFTADRCYPSCVDTQRCGVPTCGQCSPPIGISTEEDKSTGRSSSGRAKVISHYKI